MRFFTRSSREPAPAGGGGILTVGAALFGASLGLADGVPILFSDPLLLSARERVGSLSLEVLVLCLAGLLVGALIAAPFRIRARRTVPSPSSPLSLSVAVLSGGALLVSCVTWMAGIAVYAAALLLGGRLFLGRGKRAPQGPYILMCAALPPVLSGIVRAGGEHGVLQGKAALLAALIAASLALYLLVAFLPNPVRKASRIAPALVPFLIILLSLSAILAAWGFSRPPRPQYTPSESRAPNLVFVLADALRRDHLGAYGYPGDVSPVMDELAHEGAYFTTAVAAAPQTRSSLPSIMASQPPSAHGVDMRGDFEKAIPPGMRTLAEMLAAAGYRTAAFVSNPWVKVTGLDRGFQDFNDSTRLRKLTRTGSKFYLLCMKFWSRLFNCSSVYPVAARLNSSVIRWLGERGGEPFFLYIHYMDTHDPYIPPPRFVGGLHNAAETYNEARACLNGGGQAERERGLDLLRQLYDGEIHYLDSKLGELLVALEELGLRENTLVLVTADHGEEFGEHGDTGHGQTLYDEVLLVPLILNMPGKVEGIGPVRGQCSSLDIVPTVLSILEQAVPGGLAGVSQYPFGVNRASRDGERVICSESRERFSARSEGWKYIRDREGKREELYNLTIDPGERQNVLKNSPSVAQKMREALDSCLAECREKASSPLPAELTEEARERLESLGYVVK